MDADPRADRRSLIRTFLAVDLDGAFLDEVAALQDRLRAAPPFSKGARARWVARDAMHVTLRFFGNVEEARVEALRALVRELGRLPLGSMEVVARSLTGFPEAGRARVVVVDLDDQGVLTSLATRVESSVVALGFEPDTSREYRPHLTLARLRAPADVQSVASEVATLRPGRIVSITLYASETAATGPIYTPLERAEVPALRGA